MENVQRSCVKIYLCSNPEGSEEERKALRESVFPLVRDRCRRVYGLEFRVIDPYEGSEHRRVHNPRVRQQLLEECRKSSAGPFLVALIGQQYGSTCLPVQVEVSEFYTVLSTCQQMGLGTRVLERWYRRDENAIPASFILRDQIWEKCEESHDITMILQTAVRRCVQERSITSEKARKYFTSALENELRFALENRTQKDVERCLCYVHKFGNVSSQGRRGEEERSGLILGAREQCSEDDPLTYLREQILPSLVPSSRLLVHTSAVTAQTAQARKLYISGLCQQLHDDLLKLIGCAVVREETRLNDALFQDSLQHLDLCRIYSQLYRVESSQVQNVKLYLEQSDTKYPLILSGRPCTGKTVLLAHCASQVGTWLHDKNPVVIARFLGSESNTLNHLLASTCYQITEIFDGQPGRYCFLSFSQMSEAFRNLLNKVSTFKRSLVLVFDGMDQVDQGQDESCSLMWLPKSLPPNVKLLISTTPKKSGTLLALKAMYPESSLFLELGPKDRRQLSQMLTDLLVSCNRRITSGQQLYVRRALQDCPIILYVELLHRQACQWGSESEVSEEDFISGVHNNISRFLKELEKRHGKALVSRAVCYITEARFGITEAELTDVLSADDSILSRFLPGGETLPYKLRLPEAVVEHLLLDLQGFLVKRYAGGSEVLFWASRHFPLVIRRLYLNSANKTQAICSALADYFSGRWAYGRTKSLIIDGHANKKSEVQSVSHTSPVKIYIDRQHPGQPWRFEFPSSLLVRVNLRKILELPYHLKASGRLGDLGESVMMSFQFHQAMLEAGRLDELVSKLEDTALFVFHQELGLLVKILRESACLLQCFPKDLPMCMQAKLLPFINLFPGLQNYAKQCFEEGMKSNKLVAVHPSVAVVPSACWRLSEVERFPIVQVLHLQCDSIVIILLNGSIWAWNEKIPGGFQLIHLSNLKCSSAKSTQNFVLLSSEHTRLLFFDLCAPLCISEVDIRSSVPDPGHVVSTQTLVEGFFVLDKLMFVWYKNASYVSMFNINTGVGLPPLQCQSTVTCMSYSPDRQYVLCGQDNGTVSLFDAHSQRHLSTLSYSTGKSVFAISHFQQGAELVCMDNFGGVHVWDTETTSEPKLKKSCCFTENQEEVLNTDFSKENQAFLVCKRHQVLLWDTEEWAVKEQFSVPAGKAFTQALITNTCQLVIASLVDFPFLLAWKMATGQCVLSLNVGHRQTINLFKLESTLLAVTANGTLTAWDLDVILGASAISRTGTRVTKIILGSLKGQIYTADGTEMVWQWDMHSGRAVASFQHKECIEAFDLSADCEHLITAASVDIYVWRTDTGQNLHRICSSCPVSHLLITPNGNVVVSLCERGLSRVWKLRTGHIVCNIHVYLRNAVVSCESTFVLGIDKHDLLAVSLWSGCVSKRFSCSNELSVLAFKPLLQNPNYVVVVTISGCLFTWNLIEETIYHHLQLPCTLLNEPDLFQVSTDGSYAIISTDERTVNILDTKNKRLCVLQAEGPVLLVSLDSTGRFIVFICEPAPSDCTCKLHCMPVLNASCLRNGKIIGRFLLGSVPTTLCLSEDLCAYVGFEDGSVGVYAICDSDVMDSSGMIRNRLKQLGQDFHCLCEESRIWQPMTKHTVTWVDSIFKVV